jgi:hypothetical protein
MFVSRVRPVRLIVIANLDLHYSLPLIDLPLGPYNRVFAFNTCTKLVQ